MNGFSEPYSKPPIAFPASHEQLNTLLLRYHQLLKSSHEAKEKQKLLGQTQNFRMLGDVKLAVRDPNEADRLAIERILHQVSEQHKKFRQEEDLLFEELKQDIKKQQGNQKPDLDVLKQQIVGLQLLSTDLDLPPDLQTAYQQSLDTNPNAETETIDSQALIEALSDPACFSGDFVRRARALGAIGNDYSHQSSLSDSSKLHFEKVVANKLANRIRELESLPANLGTFNEGSGELDDSLKINALVELKALRVLSKQKQLRRAIVLTDVLSAQTEHAELKDVPLTLLAQRALRVRPKIVQPQPHLLASKLKTRQLLEAKKREHLLHVEKVRGILDAVEEINARKERHWTHRNHIARNVHTYHLNTEKDESKKLEKTARQRLQALKSNDEEAYMKLLDQTKDHRITHLLKQTNLFLDSLAHAVKAQQLGDPEPQEQNPDEVREKIDYYQVAHSIKEEIKEQPKMLVGGQLKEYQLKGLQWMVSLYNNKLNGILADEMGLGKTIQSISLISYLIEKKGEDKFLVIVPLSTITNWTLEFEKWAPGIKVIVYKGSQLQRKNLQWEVRLGNFQVLLTTYEFIIRERPLLAKVNYSHMIIDEGHRMKNTESKLSVTLKTYYKTKNRLILTGTPLQNNLPELWALLNFVLPRIFNSVKSFDEWFNTPFANTGTLEKIELTEEELLLVIRRLHKVLRPFLLRRLKKDVEKDLPDKVEKVLKCNLSGLQYILYQQMLKHNALFVGAEVGSAKSGIKGLNNKIMQLRKICNHPFVFEEVEDVLNPSRMTNNLIWRSSGKFELLDRVLPKFKASGHRVLLFFQMTSVMDIMEDFLRLRNMKYLRLDGATKAEDRQEMLKLFNAPDSEYFCFLLSTRAGGLGLNLQSADTVIIFDTDWNPHQDLQAQDRAHRIGQKNEVRILRLITNESVEEVILERAHQKLDIDGKVIQAGKFDNKSTAEEQEEFLKRLLEAESDGENKEDNSALDDEELNEILARSEDEKDLFLQIDNERILRDKVELRKPDGYKTRLMNTKELPSIFTEDISHHFEKNPKDLTRTRERKRVKYDDGLTEEQWLMAMDDDDDLVEAAIARKEARAERKRRKREAGDETLDEDMEDIEEEEPSRAKSSTVNDEDLVPQCTGVLDEITALVAEDGHSVHEVFEKLPPRKLYPDYYKIIKKPISLKQIRKGLQNDDFDSFDAFLDALKLMCSNAKTYNEEGSWVWNDADAVEEVISNHK